MNEYIENVIKTVEKIQSGKIIPIYRHNSTFNTGGLSIWELQQKNWPPD